MSAYDVCEMMGTSFEQVLAENARAAEQVVEAAITIWERTGQDDTLPLVAWIDRIAMRGSNGMLPYKNINGGDQTQEQESKTVITRP